MTIGKAETARFYQERIIQIILKRGYFKLVKLGQGKGGVVENKEKSEKILDKTLRLSKNGCFSPNSSQCVVYNLITIHRAFPYVYIVYQDHIYGLLRVIIIVSNFLFKNNMVDKKFGLMVLQNSQDFYKNCKHVTFE